MRYDDYKKAVNILKEISKNPSRYKVIHYACEGFYNTANGRSSHINCIAIRNYNDGQTRFFSIQDMAEMLGISYDQIIAKYDELEKKMLEEYFAYISKHVDTKWIHWNMRDDSYGFQAIEHRYKVLCGGKTKNFYIIDDDKKLDAARLMIQKYSADYIGKPRLQLLLEKNKDIPSKDFLDGRDEAVAFKNQEYNKLKLSTLRKVDAIENIVHHAADNKLLVDSNYFKIHGTDLPGLYQILNDTLWGKTILAALSFLTGAVFTKLFDKVFKF